MKLQTPLNTDGKEFFEDKRLDVQKISRESFQCGSEIHKEFPSGAPKKRDHTVSIKCKSAPTGTLAPTGMDA